MNEALETPRGLGALADLMGAAWKLTRASAPCGPILLGLALWPLWALRDDLPSHVGHTDDPRRAIALVVVAPKLWVEAVLASSLLWVLATAGPRAAVALARKSARPTFAAVVGRALRIVLGLWLLELPCMIVAFAAVPDLRYVTGRDPLGLPALLVTQPPIQVCVPLAVSSLVVALSFARVFAFAPSCYAVHPERGLSDALRESWSLSRGRAGLCLFIGMAPLVVAGATILSYRLGVAALDDVFGLRLRAAPLDFDAEERRLRYVLVVAVGSAALLAAILDGAALALAAGRIRRTDT